MNHSCTAAIVTCITLASQAKVEHTCSWSRYEETSPSPNSSEPDKRSTRGKSRRVSLPGIVQGEHAVQPRNLYEDVTDFQRVIREELEGLKHTKLYLSIYLYV